MSKTREQWIAEALHEMEQATWPPIKWCGAIMDGYPLGHEYNWQVTHNYKAQVALWNAVHPPNEPAPAPPPPPPTGILAQRIVFMSSTSYDHCNWLDEYLNTPGTLILFSADLNLSKPDKAYYVTDAQLGQIRSRGREYGWWCDGTATPISEAKKLQATRGGVCVVGQWETDAQYDALVTSGVGLGVGDAGGLSQSRIDDAIRRTASGELRLTGEMMWCNPGYSAQGIAIQSVTVYTDRDAAQGGYQPLAAFVPLPTALKRSSCLYTGGRSTPADWALWRSWMAA